MKKIMRLNQLLALAAGLAGLISGANGATTGQWDFNDGNLAATIGIDLEYRDADTLAGTQFGTTTALGIPNINGEVAMVMKFPKTTTPSGGYAFYSGAAANGGGSLLNQYTILMDVYFPSASSGKNRAILQTD